MTLLVLIGLVGIAMGAISNSNASVIAGIALIALSFIGNPDEVKNTFKMNEMQIAANTNKGE
jgi:hypothetical protein